MMDILTFKLVLELVEIAWIFIFLFFYFFPSEDPALLSYRRGDLLFIIKDGEFSSEECWIKARNERTNQTGAVNLDAIRILPMLSRPTEETLVNMILLFHSNLWRKLLLSTGHY